MHRFFVIMTVLCVCAGTLWGRSSQRTQAAAVSEPARVDAAVAAAPAGSVLPVIIRLRTESPASAYAALSADDKTRYTARLQAQQAGLVSRHAGLLKTLKAQPVISPLVFALLDVDGITALQNDPAVAAIHLDERHDTSLFESTTTIGSATANAAGYTGAGTSVAVLDTGVLSSHEFLAGQVVGEACFSTNYAAGGATSVCPGGGETAFGTGAGAPCDTDCQHGTHVAGIVAGKQLTRGGRTVSGVAPGAKIIAVQVFTKFTSGCGAGVPVCISSYTSDEIAALEWVYANRTTGSWGTLAAINMSLGGGAYSTMADCAGDPLKPIIDTLRAAGVATVIASGNESEVAKISGPACISSAIAVGAVTAARYGTLDAPASFSNRPAAINNLPDANNDRLLDFVAPGNEIMSAISNSTTSYDDYPGTSMATPHVAGAWALLKGIMPNASVLQVMTWLRTSGKMITDTRNGDPLLVPRIDVGAAAGLAAVAASATPTRTATTVKTPTKTKSPTRTATRNPKQSATKTRTRTKTATKTRTTTVTLTASAVPTATITQTPTALPGWSTSVVNGGFEQGLPQTAWVETSVVYSHLISTADGPVVPRHGSYFAWLGGTDDEISVLSTNITIPNEATYLRFYYHAASEETLCGADTVIISVNSAVVETLPLCFLTQTSSYVPYSVNVSAFRGQSIPFAMVLSTDSSLISHFLVDDVGFVSAPSQQIYRAPLHSSEQRFLSEMVNRRTP